MKILPVITVLCLAAPLFASGEYDGFHIGFRGGLAWSPDKAYGGLGITPENPSGTLKGGMQLAPTVGVHAQYSVVPGRFNLGTIIDYIKPLGTKSVPEPGGENISQKILRGELRFGMAVRSNEDEGGTFWISPTFNRSTTSDDHHGNLTENKAGGAIGYTGMAFRERCLTYWETGLYYVPTTSLKTKAGELTLELRAGVLF